MSLEVVGLYSHPVKGCAPIDLIEATFTDQGIEHDREWMLIGANGQFLTQRVYPQLALVKTEIISDALLINAPGQEELAIPLQRRIHLPEDEIAVNVFKKPGTGILERPEAHDYFTRFLGKSARIIRAQQLREIKPECQIEGAGNNMAFADGFPTLITSIASLDELNQHLPFPISVDRFRGNIVFKGGVGYDEDYWRRVLIGDQLTAFIVRACARCPVPNIAQVPNQYQAPGTLPSKGERYVTQALRATRSGIDPVGNSEGEFFGQNATHPIGTNAVVHLGDNITVLERSTERNFKPTTIAA